MQRYDAETIRGRGDEKRGKREREGGEGGRMGEGGEELAAAPDPVTHFLAFPRVARRFATR